MFGSSEQDLLDQLSTDDFETRLRAMHRIDNQAKENPRWLSCFRNKLELFNAFDQIIKDTRNWEVQHQCIRFLAEHVSDIPGDAQWCFGIIFPSLLPQLGSLKITVRRTTVQCLTAYLKVVPQIDSFLDALCRYALRPNNPRLKDLIKEIPGLFVVELTNQDWYGLVEGLSELLIDCDRECTDLIFDVFEKLVQLAGQVRYNSWVARLQPRQRAAYDAAIESADSGTPRFHALHQGTSNGYYPDDINSRRANGNDNSAKCRYGVVPMTLYEDLSATDATVEERMQALENLKNIIHELPDREFTRKLQPHLFSYLNLITGILNEMVLKTVVLALEILLISVEKLQELISPYYKQVSFSTIRFF